MAELPSSSPAATGLAVERLLAGRYRLVRRLARGGMAEVWEAVDEVLRRPVAIKVLHAELAADPAFVARFRREAVAAARLSHPNIVAIYDTCSDGDIEAIVMELVRGVTLRQVLDRRGALPPPDAAAIAAQVAAALACAHEAGIVHRDVKPGNILLTADGRVLVADFGIAKALLDDGDLTLDETVLGTAKYLAPEQVTGGPVDARTDLYALGVVLYELLTGRAPFDAGSSAATAALRLHDDPLLPRQHRAGIPRPLEDVVLRAMARRPDDRWPDAQAFRTALQRTAPPPDGGGADPTVTGLAASPHQPAPTFAQSERSWLVPAIVILLVAAALAVAGVTLGRTRIGQSLFEEAREAVGGSPGPTAAVVPTRIVDAEAFDPMGTDGENDAEVPRLLDGDTATAWHTERYFSRADFRGLKDGVGVVLALDRAGPVGELQVRSPTRGWAAQVFVAPAPATTLAGWGDPVASATAIDGDRTFDLKGTPGGFVLLWITDIGTGDPARATISELRLGT